MKSLILLVTLWSFNLGLTGCALLTTQPEETFEGPLSKTFLAPYDEVWRALQKTLSKYPIQTNNIELGVIETDFVRGPDRFVAPHKTTEKIGNYRYQLNAKIVRGRIRGKESARVDIQKVLTFEKDFFSGEKKLLSDGYEEKVILYRITRELQLDRSLRRAFESRQMSPDDF